jgi:hypothetical protein
MQRFVDVSNNNGHVDFKAVKAAGAIGVYLKVTEGTGFVDATYAANYAAAKAAGLKVGGYHFGHPQNSASQEAGFFLTHLKLEKGDLRPCLDLETTDKQSVGAVRSYGSTFLNLLKSKTGEAGILYSGSYFMSANGLLGRPERKWVASYGATPKSKWDAWQYTDGQAQYPGSICKLDTSEVSSISLFEYKASPVKKARGLTVAALKKYSGYYAWREWRLGIGRWKYHKPGDKAARPVAAHRITKKWWAKFKAMLPQKSGGSGGGSAKAE